MVVINIMKKTLVLIIIILCSFQISLSIVSASESKYDDMIELALETANGINTEHLSIYIGNVYNVVDLNGEVIGYSFGYFVDEQPYGYAIYSIEKNCIKEFSFAKGIENIYLELSDNSKKIDDVNSKKLVDGIVYTNGIDYAVIDNEGNMLSTNGEVIKDNSNVDYIKESLENNNNCKNVLPYMNKPVGDYWKGIDYADIQKKDIQYFCVVRDCGLAMISQDYVYNNCLGYCCGVSSATGCLNWMGYLVNGSIADTYFDLWNKCETSVNSYETINGRTFYIGGAYAYVGLNKFFAERGLTTRVTHKNTPSFDDYIRSINFGNGKEGTPAIINIGSTDGYHSLVVLSYYETRYSSQENYDRYIGVFNNWFYSQNDAASLTSSNITGVHSNSSINSIRYINYDELAADSGINFDGEFFSNVSSRNIKEVKALNCTANGYDVECYVPYGTKYLFFPTWTADSNGSDVIWNAGTITNDVVGTGRINVSAYNNKSGVYVTHIYAYDANMNLLATYATLYVNINRDITNVQVTNKTSTGYTVTCTLPTGTKTVKFPTWTIANNQDDLSWYIGNISGTTASRRIYISNHNNEKGTYVTDIYAYDSSGNILSNARAIVDMN